MENNQIEKQVDNDGNWFMKFLLALLRWLEILDPDNGEDDKVTDNFPSTIPDCFGVSTHFTGEKIDIDLIKDAGFKMVRTDIFWHNVEKKEGIFEFEGQGYDDLTSSLIKHGIKPYYILAYSNKLYEDNRSIVTKEGQDAFVKFASEAAARYKGLGIIWEVWNEPNSKTFWETQPNFDDYSSLLKRVAEAVKENDPSGTVVAPALAGVNDTSLNWLEGILKKDILNNIDALSVHPYRSQNPETVINDYAKLRNLLAKYTDKETIILSGEWGYSTAKGAYNIDLDEETQANYLVRMFMINLLSKVPVSIWYDWKNDGNNPANKEHNFGIVQNDLKTTKKAYFALNALNYILSGYQLKERIDVGNPDDYILHFMDEGNNNVLVCWTSSSQHQSNIPFSYTEGRILSMYGEKIGDVKEGSELKLDLVTSPKYIVMRNRS
ncbi:cellulase family glycosylhydrolase [Priestia aryabhattai]|uniref:cellulase family glycosylhydrolase n=1 Tax=Priestia aryabhattai TaxID=412384 RepID=UPI003C8F481B